MLFCLFVEAPAKKESGMKPDHVGQFVVWFWVGLTVVVIAAELIRSHVTG